MALTDHPRPAAQPDLRRVGLLVAGDTLVFLLFAAVGRASHGEAAGLDALLQVLETAAPFAAAWFLVAPFAKLYRAEVASGLRPTLARGALAWLVALPIGMLLRMLLRREGIPPTSFFVTSYIFVLMFMFSWRGLYVWLTRRRNA
ncbi:MAG TPA: DUF3054 domain-containing protein [Roseiflexaceae bacterium]|nr:DUF3054 domain-containing protein [Roseiflexaceae bacterium]